MTMINYASREINCKIVYYGTGLGGKTTNLEYIYSRVNPDTKGKMISLATETERTLFFDFLPIDLGEVRGFKTRFHLYTVPGQVYYNASPLSANVRETRSTQRIRVGRRQRKRTCWDCEREWKRMVVPLEPGRPSEARQLLRTQR